MHELVREMLAKAQPTLQQVHANVPLTNISVAYANKKAAYIAARAFPVINVVKESDLYYTFPKEYWFRTEAGLRAPGDPTRGTGYTNSTATYSTQVYGIHHPIPDRIRRNQDSALDVDRQATELVTQHVLLLRDLMWATNYFATGKWTNESTPSTLWSAANSTPIKDIRTQMTARQKATGYRPNTLILGREVWDALQDNEDITDRMDTTADKKPTTGTVANMLELDNVLIAEAVKNTAVEGATEVMDFICGKHALVCYVEPSPGLMKPSAGYTFVSSAGVPGAGSTGFAIKKWYNQDLASTKVECEGSWDMKQVADDLGHFFLSAVS